MTKNEIVLMGKIYLIFNPSQFLWDTSEMWLYMFWKHKIIKGHIYGSIP